MFNVKYEWNSSSTSVWMCTFKPVWVKVSQTLRWKDNQTEVGSVLRNEMFCTLWVAASADYFRYFWDTFRMFLTLFETLLCHGRPQGFFFWLVMLLWPAFRRHLRWESAVLQLKLDIWSHVEMMLYLQCKAQQHIERSLFHEGARIWGLLLITTSRRWEIINPWRRSGANLAVNAAKIDGKKPHPNS